MSVLNEMKVGKVIIGKQGKDSKQYSEFCKIVEERKIQVVVVEKGGIINVEKNLKIKVLFPEKTLISENILNNNSLVLKLEYKKFSMLFTGDIEEIAEKRLLKIYSKEDLKSDILKVAHHGSKSSSSLKFLEAVSPSIAVIGVGKSNKFGHPSEEVLNRFKELRY